MVGSKPGRVKPNTEIEGCVGNVSEWSDMSIRGFLQSDYCIDVVFKLRFHSDATQFYLKYKKNSIWMSECLLTTSGQLFSYIMAKHVNSFNLF
jgi:hypothetical protein